MEPSAAGERTVKGTYLQISAEGKTEIGQCATKYGVVATVRYCATKLPVSLTNSGLSILSSTNTQNYFNKTLKTMQQVAKF